jgi:hypothetical protein
MSLPEALAQEFQSLEEARKTIQNFVIDLGESFKVSHADQKRYVIVCRDTSCKFSIRAAVLKGPKYRVTRYTPHSCSPITHQNFRFAHSVSFLAERH